MPYISRDPDVMAGTPCLRGTRIPVSMILGDILDGLALHEIADDRDLTLEELEGLFGEIADVIDGLVAQRSELPSHKR